MGKTSLKSRETISVSKPTLWVFGSSNCLPHGLDNPNDTWAQILANHLGANLNIYAQEACDNLFIYSRLIQCLDQISSNDYVVIGWTHPNRKTWVSDIDNPVHQQLLQDEDTIVYPGTPTFMRAYNNNRPTSLHWANLGVLSKGKEFFDQWFKNYYSRYEQDLNMQAYIDSAELKIPCRKLFFFFSNESLTGIDYSEDAIGCLDFVIENNVNISDSDMHANTIGHRMLAEIFLKKLTIA